MRERTLSLRTLACAATAALAQAASASAPKPVPPLDLPAIAEPAPPQLSRWWRSFDDPVLDSLIDEALAHNADLLLAAQRLNQARAALEIAHTNRLPAIDVGADAQRARASELRHVPGRPRTDTFYGAGFTVSYELDLSGRLAAARDAAAARLAASEYARSGIGSAVAAQVARAYFTLRALDAEQALLEQTLRFRSDALALQKRRLDAGVISAAAYAQFEAQRAAVAAVLPGVRAAREQARIAIAALLGRSPRELLASEPIRGATLEALNAAPEIPAGLHSELLARRPDVRAAEAQLAAADADLRQARARWFPSIALTGFLGGESTSLGNLLAAASRTWNVGALIAQPLVGLVRVGAETREAQAVREQAELTYRQAARQAYADALTALSAHRGARETLEASRTLVDSQSRARDLIDRAFQGGTASRIELLDAERERLAAERQLLAAGRDRLIALVNVYQALGGGW
ncbi:MAG TPA: efflux transporter outer membrane subunit [Burkholderiaceae bacterium]|nr:efflux transporter outer membrane subunit [Burkholderiaceae bacterium]